LYLQWRIRYMGHRFFRYRGEKYLILTPDLAISGIVSVSIITNVIYKSADFKKLCSFF
jgi:hypothetical protein